MAGIPVSTEAYLGITLIAVGALPLGRLAFKQPIRREVRAHPFQSLALGILAVSTIGALLWSAGFDARIVSDGPAVRGNNHWVHWRPNKSLRVALTARAG
jgi:hypothetical protein